MSRAAAAGKAGSAAPAARRGTGPGETTPAKPSRGDLVPDYREVAELAVKAALDAGATGADAMVGAGRKTSIKVTQQEIEELTQAGSKSMGLRVLVGTKSALLYTSDFTKASVKALAKQAVDLAGKSGEDPFAAIPPLPGTVRREPELDLVDYDLPAEPLEAKIARALRCEAAAETVSPLVKNTQGTRYYDHIGASVLASSNGFLGRYQGTQCGLSTVPIAIRDGKRQTDYWSTNARFLGDLDEAEEVGRIAAIRSLARLGGHVPETGEMPIVFDPTAAASLIDHQASAASGGAVFRDASFLKEKLGESIAPEGFELVDDPLLVRGLSSRPWDGEGLPSKRNVLVQGGVLKRFLTDSYSARKLKKPLTHSAARGTASGPGVGTTNLYLTAGPHSPAEILASVDRGVYVTSFMGHGVNLVTGDYSRGATGFMIEKGRLTDALQGFTIAGNLLSMFRNVAMIGNDLRMRDSVSCPTLRINGMMVGGK